MARRRPVQIERGFNRQRGRAGVRGRGLRRGLRAAVSRAVLGVAAGAVVVVLLAGLTPTEEPADLRVVDAVSIATLDPAQISWLQDIRIVHQLYEGLYSPDPDGQGVVPGCAERLDTSGDEPGATLHRYRIREGSRWSNGEPVRAEDFVFAWRRAIEPGTARDYAFFVEFIRGMSEYAAWRHAEVERIAGLDAGARPAAVEAHLNEADRRFAEQVGLRCEDGRTLRVELARPVAYWAELLANPVYLPLHRATVERYRRVGETGLIHYEPTWCKPGNTHYNGPYVLERWRFRRGLRLRKNPYFREAADVRVETVEHLDVADVNTAWLMYESGRVDWLLSLEASFAPALVRQSGSVLPRALNREGRARRDVHAFTAFGTYFYNFNCGPTTPDGGPNPFADARVRRAFARAVDRRALCEQVTRRDEPPATALVPPGTIEGYPAVEGLAFDPKAAREELATAGWPEGRGFPEVTLLFNNEANHGLIAQSVAAMFRRHLGVRVRLVGKESQSYRQDKQRHEFMIARANWYGDYGDPTSFLDVFRSNNGNNDSAYRDAAYDEMLTRADCETDPVARLAALAACEAYLVRETAPLLPLFHYVNLYAYDPDVLSGVALNPRLLVAFRAVEVRR